MQQSAYSEFSGLLVTTVLSQLSTRSKRALLFSQEVLCMFSAAHQQPPFGHVSILVEGHV
jgi:hypothetical protein